MEKLTTSTKSVSDYFKERLLAKASTRSISVPKLEDTKPRCDSDVEDYTPRGGLGASRAQMTGPESEPTFTTTSKFASMFAGFTPSTTIQNNEEKLEKKKRKNRHREKGSEVEETKEEKRKRKEERRRAKEQILS